ncbi:hypothetical protein SOVF_017370 [Spinacia oleracea]|uniref:Uncharacterized protein isoform X2 n=1 Tax=Spinacia oleracea TaxID=3562 RepID=A0A9R0JPL8_SPIOL|nr:uncharacterized protein LOC110782598 isoform X2 [Spinacia oleracea]KNA24251.1 hypothetical protein SOVF_017370 [Spinacia oleracea]
MACPAMASPVEEQIHQHHQQRMLITEQVMNCKLKEKKQLSLENYLDYLQSRDFSKFTVGEINQIVSIHGFKKPNQRKKAEEAVKAIEPIDPARSTLREDISSSIKATIGFTEAIKDLKILNWQECSITSIKLLKPENDKIVLVSPSTTSTKSKSVKAVQQPKSLEAVKKSKLASLLSIGNGPNNSGNSDAPVFPSTAATKMQKTIKRRKLSSLTESSCSGPTNADSGGSGDASSSSFVARGKNGGGKKRLHSIVCLGPAAT